MTITSIWEAGFELGDSREEMTASATNNATTSNPKTGTYALTLGTSALYYKEHGSSLDQCRISLHARHSQPSGVPDLVALRSGTTDIVNVRWNANTGEWVILCGATEVARQGDAVFAITGTYFHIGIDVKIDGSAGWVYLYRDGIEVIAFDGDTADGGSTFARLVLGSTRTSTNAWAGAACDDVVWFDSTGEVAPAPVPDYRLYALTPNGNGNYNEWDGSDGNSTDNYLLVDEIPPNDDTDYLTTETADDTESFTMTTFTIPDGFVVEEVIPIAIARKVDALGTLGLKLGTRLSSTDSLGSTQPLGTDYTIYRERQAAKPGGGDWTQSDLDALEVIIEAAA